ncbi:MAG: hypothetical protein RMK18_03305 [Armatimonadota bacterium]|nr:hypothetical protein [Armatimonadota bacterium]MDW8024877.1 hypothetical protein [Armatimonadota bacterium]
MQLTQMIWRSIILSIIVSIYQSAIALWGVMPVVPIERLLENVGRYVRENPKDAHGHYILARLYSLAFARGVKAGVECSLSRKDKLPVIHSPFFPRRPEGAGEPDKEALNHLAKSIRHYRMALQLEPEKAIYWLGLGWVLEEGMKVAEKLPAPFLKKPKIVSKEEWRKEALNSYRRAFWLRTKRKTEEREFFTDYYSFKSIAQEAGEAIIRLQKGRRLTRAERRELAEVDKTVAELKAIPRPITPIIFPLHHPLPLSELVSSHSVTFDLDGDGIKERWQWVTKKACFLVWDGERTGQIKSGLQLFGSVTWWMFWRNGYEALAALDDDGNGWLEGKELDGIFIWHDRNSNGVSENGEVFPTEKLGIIRIAVRAMNQDGTVLFNMRGVQLNNGKFLPTYDWISRPYVGITLKAIRRKGTM